MLFSSTASFVTAVDGKVRFPAAEQNSEVHPRDETLSGEAADCVAQLFISQSPWRVQTKYLPKVPALYFLYPEYSEYQSCAMLILASNSVGGEHFQLLCFVLFFLRPVTNFYESSKMTVMYLDLL